MFIDKVPTTDPASPFMGERLFGWAPKRSFRFQFRLVFYKHFAATRFFRQTLAEELHTNSWRTVLVSCLLPPASCLLPFSFFRSQVRKQDYISNRMLVGQKHY